MHGSVFVDKSGQSLRRALLWNDQRTAAQCVEIEKKAGGRKKLISMVSNVALTGFTAPKILWVRKHDPKTYAKTFKILLPKDFIRLKLTGEYVAEVSDAAGTLLLDVKKRKWHKGLMSKLGIDSDLMALVYESPEVTGTISQRRRLRPCRCARAQSAGQFAVILPRRARQMVRFWLYALSGRQLAVAARYALGSRGQSDPSPQARSRPTVSPHDQGSDESPGRL